MRRAAAVGELELLLALHDLDRRTPAYFVQEIFSHGRLDVPRTARLVLSEGLEPRRHTARLLREVLTISPRREGEAE
jgi:hypothetical protein